MAKFIYRNGEIYRNGIDGLDGYTPVRGVDYWTAEDIEEMKSYSINITLSPVLPSNQKVGDYWLEELT